MLSPLGLIALTQADTVPPLVGARSHGEPCGVPKLASCLQIANFLERAPSFGRGVQKLCHAVEFSDLQRDRVYEPYARLEGVSMLSRCPFPDVGPL